MSKLITDPVLNSNFENFLHVDYSQKSVHQIQPNKFTFLKSNLLISNILNRNISNQKKITQQKSPNDNKSYQQNNQNMNESPDAYINCQIQMTKLKEQRKQSKQRNQRVKNLVVCRSQKSFNQFKANQKKVNDMINKVYALQRDMTDKAAQIMGKKQNNSYLGRNLFSQNDNFLKQMKQSNPTQKQAKISTTRLFMKETAKKYNHRQNTNRNLNMTLNQSNINNSSYNLNHSMSNMEGNSSFQTSLLDITIAKAAEKKQEHQKNLKKLMKNKSTDQFMQQQRRRAAWNGFCTHWRKGCEKGQQLQIQLKKKKVNKKASLKPKYQNTNNQLLNYHDHFSRKIAMKNYQNAFSSTAASFQLKIN